MITSKDNSKIKNIVMLSSSAKKRREQSTFILEGTRLCGEALREDIFVLELYYTKSLLESHPNLVNDLAKKSQFYTEVSSEVFLKMSDTKSPQGILVAAKLKSKNINIQNQLSLF